MTNDELRAIRLRIRESHRRLFTLQGTTINALREVLDSVNRAHDEMAVLMQADNDLEDFTNGGGTSV